MKPDLTITRYKADWRYVIQRFAGGSYTLQAIENQGEHLDGIAPARYVCLEVFPTEADADEAMQIMIRVNPAGTFDQALPFWVQVEVEENDPMHNGQPVICAEVVRYLETQEEKAG